MIVPLPTCGLEGPTRSSRRRTTRGEEPSITSFLTFLALAAPPQAPDSLPFTPIVVAPAETLAVTLSGVGRPVVIVPGMLGGAYGFRKVVPALVAAGHRVAIVEPLGSGQSSRPEDADYSFTAQAMRVAAVLDSLGIRRAPIVTHSVGAPVAYRLALGRPDLVESILSINGGPAESLDTPGVSTTLRLAPILRLFGVGSRARSKLVSGLLNASKDSTWVTETVIEAYGAPYRDDLWDTLRTLKRMSDAKNPELLVPALPRITAPVTLLRSVDHPAALPEEEVTALADGIARFEVVGVEDTGQYIHEERPDVVVQAVLQMTIASVARAASRPIR